MTFKLAHVAPALGDVSDFQAAYSVKDARQFALISLISPILFMVSLVAASLILLTDLSSYSSLFGFWLMAHCFACAALFLASLREKTVLFDQDLIATSSLAKRFTFVLTGFIWGAVPCFLALIEPTSQQFVFGAILSGLTFSATILLRHMPLVGKGMLAVIAGGFLANTILLSNFGSASVSMVMLVYFGILAFASRWHYLRFEARLELAEQKAQKAEELASVLTDVSYAADTYFWRTNKDGILIEFSHEKRWNDGDGTSQTGQPLLDLFNISPERDLLNSRLVRQSEIVALELEAARDQDQSTRWWKLSGRPIFENDVFYGYRGAVSDITQLRATEQRATYLAEYDNLTGLLNRKCFYDSVQEHLQQQQAGDDETAILWIDLDHFKWINDTFGHAGGDEVLKSVSRRLQEVCDPADIVCRFGGDEFAVLSTRPRIGDQLRQFVEALTEKMAEPYMLDLTEIQCSASIGFRRIGEQEDDASTLMKEADLALYSAKSGGRASWKEYSEAFKAKVRGQRDLARDLETAIQTDELTLEFQPIVDAKTQKVVAVEALSRWIHPTRGEILPTEFIAVAENNGLIIDLGDMVVAKSIVTAASLPENVRVGINISPLQIHSSALLTLIEQKLEETGVTPGRIELEITESVFLSDNSFVLERLKSLKKLGLRIVLDDFGTGFSSLAYLQRFPFDKLKLDQAFVGGIETSDQSCAIARATISMAHALNLTVTAEGVETEGQAKFLIEQGCNELQGFLYAFPQDEAALAEFLGAPESTVDHRAVLFNDPKIISLAKRSAR